MSDKRFDYNRVDDNQASNIFSQFPVHRHSTLPGYVDVTRLRWFPVWMGLLDLSLKDAKDPKRSVIKDPNIIKFYLLHSLGRKEL